MHFNDTIKLYNPKTIRDTLAVFFCSHSLVVLCTVILCVYVRGVVFSTSIRSKTYRWVVSASAMDTLATARWIR